MKIHIEKPPAQKGDQLKERVDTILDKINEVGYENLSEEEKKILYEASSRLSRRGPHEERH